MRTTIGSFRHIKSVPFQVCDRKIVSEGEYEEKANKTKQKSLPRAPDKTPDVQYTGLDLWIRSHAKIECMNLDKALKRRQ